MCNSTEHLSHIWQILCSYISTVSASHLDKICLITYACQSIGVCNQITKEGNYIFVVMTSTIKQKKSVDYNYFSPNFEGVSFYLMRVEGKWTPICYVMELEATPTDDQQIKLLLL